MNRHIRKLAALAAALSLAGAAQAQDTIKLKVVGQPLAAGIIQQNKEQPFFENLAKNTGLPIEVDYKPSDTIGINDAEQLRVLKAGLFDVISIRVLRNSRDEPMLAGLDLVGAAPDFATNRKVIDAYGPVVDQQLQKVFNIKLLGVWPFGPQILFCKKPVTQLADIKGMKVRVTDQNLAKFMEAMGATPVPLALPEVHQALALGVVDCAVTSPGSANAAGWPEVTTHQLNLGFQTSPNAYGISLRAWNRFDAGQQEKLLAAFRGLTDDIWAYAEEVHNDSLNCNAGRDPCVSGKKYKMTEVSASAADLALLRDMLKTVSLPAWAESCNKTHPGCSQDWVRAVNPILGVQ